MPVHLSITREGIMKRAKQWLEGGGIAVLSCVLVGSLILAVPRPAHAIFGHHFPGESLTGKVTYYGWTRQNCQGFPMQGSALSIYNRVGAWGSYSRNSSGLPCKNDILFLRGEARREWRACEWTARAGTYFAVASVAAVPIVAAGGAVAGASAVAATAHQILVTATYKGVALSMTAAVTAELVTRRSLLDDMINAICGRQP